MKRVVAAIAALLAPAALAQTPQASPNPAPSPDPFRQEINAASQLCKPADEKSPSDRLPADQYEASAASCEAALKAIDAVLAHYPDATPQQRNQHAFRRTSTSVQLGRSLSRLDPPMKPGRDACRAYEDALRSYVTIKPASASDRSFKASLGRQLDFVLKPCRAQFGAPVDAADLPNIRPPPPPPLGTLAGDENAALSPCLSTLNDKAITPEEHIRICERAAAGLPAIRERYADASKIEKGVFETQAMNMYYMLALLQLSGRSPNVASGCASLEAAAASRERLRALGGFNSFAEVFGQLDNLLAKCPRPGPDKL